MSHRKTGIWFAADGELTSMIEVIGDIYRYIDAVKIGYPLVLNSGVKLSKLVSLIKDVCDLPVIADLKIVDIPFIAEKIAFAALNAGCDGVTIAGICGRSVVIACKKIAKEKEVYVFTQFTHEDGLIDDKLAEKILNIAKESKVTGVQVPATKPHRIRFAREFLGEDYIIISCGVGYQGLPIGSAIKEGANYEIVGRAIYGNENPKNAAIEIRRKIEALTEIS